MEQKIFPSLELTISGKNSSLDRQEVLKSARVLKYKAVCRNKICKINACITLYAGVSQISTGNNSVRLE